jgi:UDP-glucuronate 4-epimerase
MTVLVTGVAGFVGYHVGAALLARGDSVVGIDDLNAYYDARLKEARLERLSRKPSFVFHKLDIAARGALAGACKDAGVDRVVHLAAQPGVRYSLENPFAYERSNLAGHLEVLELCRDLPGLVHLVYASSSAVYGGNAKLPFAEADRVDTPASLYAATKKAGELMSYAYSHLYRLPTTGLRLFTVYGPWGRPDMAYYSFTKAIFAGEPIRLFNRGNMKRDFTYIDDIVEGVLAALDHPPGDDGEGGPHRLYNIGNHRPEPLPRFIEVLEQATGRKARIELAPMQPDEAVETFADITAIRRDLGFAPSTPIDEGLPRFVAWFRDYHGV